jgi:hypothetical protein
LDIKDIEGLPQDEQFQRAADHAGIPVEVLRKQWQVESGSGKFLEGPQTKWGTAKGNFQVLDSTAATFEQRKGTKFQRGNLAHDLVLASEIWKENMTLARGDVALAATIYHGGTNPKNHGPVTRDYVSKLMSAVGATATQAEAEAPMPAPSLSAQEQEANAARAQAEFASQVAGASATQTVINRAYQEFEMGEAAKQEARKGGVWDIAESAFRNPAIVPTVALVNRLAEMAEGENEPGFNYAEHAADLEKDLNNDDEVELMRTMGARGWSGIANAKRQIAVMREHDEVVGQAGFWTRLAGEGLAGMADPLSMAAGAGIAKAATLTKVGHAAMVATGRPGAAVGALVAENVLGDVAISAVHDVLLDQKYSATDYAIGAAFSTVLTLPFSRGTYKSANENAIRAQVDAMSARAAEMDTTGLDPATRDAKIAQQAQQIETDFNTPGRNDFGALPPDILARTEAEYEGKAPETDEPAAPRGSGMEQSRDMNNLDDIADAADELLAAGDVQGAIAVMGDARTRIADFESQLFQSVKFMDTFSRADEALQKSKDNSPKVVTEEGRVLQVRFDFKQADINAPMRTESPEKTRATLRESLEAILAPSEVGKMNSHAAAVGRALLKNLPASILDNGWFSFRHVSGETGLWQTSDNSGFISTPEDAPSGHIRDVVPSLGRFARETVVHEIGHAVTAPVIEFVERTMKAGRTADIPADILEGYMRGKKLMERLAREFPEQVKMKGGGAGYATTDVHEFFSQALSDHDTRTLLASMPASHDFGGKFSTMLAEVLDAIKQMLGFKGKGTALDEAWYSFELLASARSKYTFKHGSTLLPAGAEPGWAANRSAPIPPTALAVASNAESQRIVAHAEQWLAANPVDTSRLNVATKWIGAASQGVTMASSKNPVLKMMAGMLIEVTTGAAGRRQTAALRKMMLEKKMVGNLVLDYETNWQAWAKANNVNIIDRYMQGEGKRAFDKAVYTEILARRNGTPGSLDAAVKNAADATEATMERALQAQRQAATLGSQRLPANSVGYIPQALDGRKLAAASAAELAELREHLSAHFARALGWDTGFANDFALTYINRARAESMTPQGRGVDGQAAANNPETVVRDTLLAMQQSVQSPYQASLVLKAQAALSAKGLGQTKHRLDVDLLGTLPGGKQVMDFYNTDVLTLSRRYVARTSGNVALTEFGVHGADGWRKLRNAVVAAEGDKAATKAEIEAADAVMAEMLGYPVPTAVRSNASNNLRMLVGLQRLGSVAWNQVAESMQLVTHLGLDSLLNGVASMPRMFGEVGRLKRGLPSNNHILTSIEQYGGEIGMEHYKMVMPLDPADDNLAAYGQDPGLIARLLNGGGHVQSKITAFRAIMAVQHRMAAEQIVMKAARMIRDGGNTVSLRDMGFTDELVNHMRQHINSMATWDASGKLVSFDITRLPNPAAAEAFVQSVHRGTSQMIQGTFIGEKSAWMHNDYLKLLLQLRTFGLVSTEKQWARSRMNHGYTVASAMLVAQMGLALPIYAARVHSATILMDEEQKKKYVKQQMDPKYLARALMNYASMSGIGSDVFDLLDGISGGWTKKATGEAIGPRGDRPLSITGQIPVVGSVEQAAKVASGHAKLYNALKQLPMSNVWYLAPIINAAK